MTLTIELLQAVGAEKLAAIAQKLKAREHVARSIGELRTKLAGIDQEIARAVGRSGPAKGSKRAQARPAPGAKKIARVAKTRIRAARARKFARPLAHILLNVLQKEGKPLPVVELTRKVIAAGYQGARKNLGTTIHATVARGKETFRRFGRGVVGLVTTKTAEPVKA